MIYFSIFYLNLDKRVLGELIRKSARNQIIKNTRKNLMIQIRKLNERLKKGLISTICQIFIIVRNI